jgi:hypothetical protein
MNKEQAQQILLRYRPANPEPDDPELRAALELANLDTELGAWLQQELAFHDRVRKSLRSIEAPADLRARILAQRTISHPRFGWSSAWLAAAASLVFLATIWGSWALWHRPNRFAAYRQRMVREAVLNYRMDILTNDLPSIRAYLAHHGGLSDYELSGRLQQLPGTGGAVLKWRNEPVTMVCFNAGLKGDLYLFVVNRNLVPGFPDTAAPQLEQVGKLMTASWVQGDRAYLLAGARDASDLGNFLR